MLHSGTHYWNLSTKAWRRPLVCWASAASSVRSRQSAPLLKQPHRGEQMIYCFPAYVSIAFSESWGFFHSVCLLMLGCFGGRCRRFLLRHLAQIKHILPEAVHLDWVRSYDADTREKKWEVRISLLPMPAEEVEPNASGSTKKKPRVDTVQRRRVFHSRLVKFASTHPEVSSTIKCHGF